MDFDMEKLILDIKQRPALWDLSSDEYSNKNLGGNDYDVRRQRMNYTTRTKYTVYVIVQVHSSSYLNNIHRATELQPIDCWPLSWY
jgi:hypothetical protein